MLRNAVVVGAAFVGVALCCEAVLQWLGYRAVLLSIWLQ
jgi:hypothetical protein